MTAQVFSQKTHNQLRVEAALANLNQLEEDGSFKPGEKAAIAERLESLKLRFEAFSDKREAAQFKKEAANELNMNNVSRALALIERLEDGGVIDKAKSPYTQTLNCLRNLHEIVFEAIRVDRDREASKPSTMVTHISPSDPFIKIVDLVTDWSNEEGVQDLDVTETSSLIKRIANLLIQVR